MFVHIQRLRQCRRFTKTGPLLSSAVALLAVRKLLPQRFKSWLRACSAYNWHNCNILFVWNAVLSNSNNAGYTFFWLTLYFNVWHQSTVATAVNRNQYWNELRDAGSNYCHKKRLFRRSANAILLNFISTKFVRFAGFGHQAIIANSGVFKGRRERHFPSPPPC